MKVDHIESDLCDGTPEGCSDPKHLPYDEMRSTIKQAIEEAENTEKGSSDKLFQITKFEQLLAPHNVNDELKLQILYRRIRLIKSKPVDITIGLFGPPDTGVPSTNEPICHGSFCHNEGESEKATHALGWINHENAKGVICLLCPFDYMMANKDPEYLKQIGLACLDYAERQKLI